MQLTFEIRTVVIFQGIEVVRSHWRRTEGNFLEWWRQSMSWLGKRLKCLWASQVALVVKNHLSMQETLRDVWVRKIPWRRAWWPTPAFLSGESHGQRTLRDVWVRKIPWRRAWWPYSSIFIWRITRTEEPGWSKVHSVAESDMSKTI